MSIQEPLAPIEKILQYLAHADRKEIDGVRCFIVERHDYYSIVDLLNGEVHYRHFLAENLEGFDILAGAKDKGHYFICTETVPVLDILWDAKAH